MEERGGGGLGEGGRGGGREEGTEDVHQSRFGEDSLQELLVRLAQLLLPLCVCEVYRSHDNHMTSCD